MKKVRQFVAFLEKAIEKLENTKMTIWSWLLSFLAVVFLRNFLESFSGKINFLTKEHWFFFFFHSVACYLFGIMLFILITHYLTKERIEKISRIALFGVFFILIPPLAELVVSGGAGGLLVRYGDFSSFGTLNFGDLFQLFGGWIIDGPFGLLFAGPSGYPLQHLSYNYGTRIDAILIALALLWYVFLKTRNFWKTLFVPVAFYLVSFLICCFPYFLTTAAGTLPNPVSLHSVSYLNSDFSWDQIVSSAYLVGILVFAGCWLFFYDKNILKAISKNVRPFRLLHNLAMLGLGLYLGGRIFGPLSLFDYLLMLMAFLSIVLYWLSVIGYDDLCDEKIDKISNPDRPIPRGLLSREQVFSLSGLFLAGSYLFALMAGYTFFVLVFLRSLILPLYSKFPFRLKRFPLIATFLLASAAVLTILAGFAAGGSDLLTFPRKLILFLLLAFTFGFMAKDIKDYEGDKADKIYTVPVLFGLEKSKRIIGFLVALVFVSVPFLFFEYFKILMIPSVLAALIGFCLFVRENFSERPLFLVYFAYGLFFILTVFNPWK